MDKIAFMEQYYNKRTSDIDLSSWNEKYEILKECYTQHITVSANLVYKGVKIGQWVHNTNRRKKQNGTLTKQQENKLKACGITYKCEEEYLKALDDK